MKNDGVKRILFRESKKISSLGNLVPRYTPLSLLLRILINSAVAIAVMQFIIYVVENSVDPSEIKDVGISEYLRIVIYFNILGEAQIIADYILEYFFPVPKKIRLRIFLQFITAVASILFIFRITTMVDRDQFQDVTISIIYLGTALGLLFVLMLSTSLLLIRLTEKWFLSQKQLDQIKQEKLQMDYNSLQDQLNPHFLFNNLSVLKSLIIYDKNTAVKFTENFTDVYRYVLQSKDKRLVDFSEEYRFIEAYIGLHKERLGDGLTIKFSIGKEAKDSQIAPLTLQLLVENAIKHNTTGKSSPLDIEIETTGKYLFVKNNVQLKKSSYSTKTGLLNLIKRYQFLSKQEIEIYESNTEFEVKIPLL